MASEFIPPATVSADSESQLFLLQPQPSEGEMTNPIIEDSQHRDGKKSQCFIFLVEAVQDNFHRITPKYFTVHFTVFSVSLFFFTEALKECDPRSRYHLLQKIGEGDYCSWLIYFLFTFLFVGEDFTLSDSTQSVSLQCLVWIS